VHALVSRCSFNTFEWISGLVFGTRLSITLRFSLDGRPGRRPLIGSRGLPGLQSGRFTPAGGPFCCAVHPAGRGRSLSACLVCVFALRLAASCAFAFRVAPLPSPVPCGCTSVPGVPLGTFRYWPPCFGLRSGHGLQLLSSRLEFRFVRPSPFLFPSSGLALRSASLPAPLLARPSQQGRWARLRSSLRVFSRTGFRWLSVTISPNEARVERVIRFSGEKFHRFKTGCGIVALARKSDCPAIARARPRAGRRVAENWSVGGAKAPSPLGEGERISGAASRRKGRASRRWGVCRAGGQSRGGG